MGLYGNATRKADRCGIKGILLFGLIFINVCCVGEAKDITNASIQIFPAESRKNKTAYMFGGELNSLGFTLSNDGRYENILPLLTVEQSGKLAIRIKIPTELDFHGFMPYAETFYFAKNGKKVVIDGAEYKEYLLVPAKKQFVEERLFRKDKRVYPYPVSIWFTAPDKFTGKLYWNFEVDGKPILKTSTKIKTIGMLKRLRKSPSKFKLFMWRPDPRNLPPELMKRRANFYRRLGITDFNFMYSNYPQEKNALTQAETIRAEGIKLNAERSGSFVAYLVKMLNPKKYGKKGLIGGAAEMRQAIQSPKEVQSYRTSAAPYTDGFQYDYETYGPSHWPEYNDVATVAAFARSINFKGVLSAKEVKEKYAKQYARFRMKLLCAPIVGVREMLNKVKPNTPLFLTHGSGVPLAEIDYKDYDNYVTYHLPMIYTNLFNFQQKVFAFAKYISGKRIIPVTALAESKTPILYQSEITSGTLNTVACAVAGTAGIAHWPGIKHCDAAELYAFHQGVGMSIPFLDFFRKGTIASDITAKPQSYIKKIVRAGAIKIDLSQPIWKNFSVVRTHTLGSERSVAVLNYNRKYDLFALIKGKFDKPMYLLNPWRRVIIALNGNKKLTPQVLAQGVLVKIPPMNADIWLLTPDAKKAEGYTCLEAKTLNTAFEKAKKAFKKKGGGDIQLGTKGDLTVGYDNFKGDDGEERVCVKVSCPGQELRFLSAGGRLWQWSVGESQIIKNHNISQDGFGMDLLWQPKSARWCGDQISEMRLSEVKNDGKVVSLVYEGEFSVGWPGLKIVKTFLVSGSEPEVEIQWHLRNDTYLPVEFMYWMHNVISGLGERQLISGGKSLLDAKKRKKNSIFLRTGTPKSTHSQMINSKWYRGNVSNMVGEYYPSIKLGIAFELPENFFQLYRWDTPNVCGTEWTLPLITLPAGGKIDFKSKIRVFSDISATHFAQKVKAK